MKAGLRFVDIRNNALRIQKPPPAPLPPNVLSYCWFQVRSVCPQPRNDQQWVFLILSHRICASVCICDTQLIVQNSRNVADHQTRADSFPAGRPWAQELQTAVVPVPGLEEWEGGCSVQTSWAVVHHCASNSLNLQFYMKDTMILQCFHWSFFTLCCTFDVIMKHLLFFEQPAGRFPRLLSVRFFVTALTSTTPLAGRCILFNVMSATRWRDFKQTSCSSNLWRAEIPAVQQNRGILRITT